MKVGFIGTGIMGSAMMEGLIKNKTVAPTDITGADVFAPGREKVRELYGINVTADNKEAVNNSDIIMSTKPYFYADIIDEIRDCITEDKIIIAMAAGITLDFMNEHIAKPAKVVRMIPNCCSEDAIIRAVPHRIPPVHRTLPDLARLSVISPSWTAPL